MDVIVVAVPGPHLRHPRFLVLLDAAQLLLDHGVDQHALDLGRFGRRLDEGDVLRRPGFRIEALPVVRDQIDRRDLVALFLAQGVGRHRHEPDVDVQPGGVAHVIGRQRAAARLRHVADQNAFPAGGLGGAGGEFFQEADQVRMAPVAIA